MIFYLEVMTFVAVGQVNKHHVDIERGFLCVESKLIKVNLQYNICSLKRAGTRRLHYLGVSIKVLHFHFLITSTLGLGE